MIDFRTLGAAELEENLETSVRPIAVQAKRLALVAYLALAGPGRSRRRDSIVGLFWPDLDEEHARSALRQALSYLRRTLGGSALVTRGEEEVSLAPEAVRCDAVRFDQALAQGRLQEAMALYRGDFLEGLFVSDGSPELEHWIDAERDRLRLAAAAAAWELAEAGRRQADPVAAAGWGRRAASLAPADEGGLRRLIALLDSIGDRAGAIEAYDRFAHRLASEYAARPSPETEALIDRVRSRSAAEPPAGSAHRAPAWPAPPDSSATHTHPPPPPPPARRTRLAVLGASFVLVVAASTAAYLRAARASPATLAVVPAEDPVADSTSRYLAEALTDQLITELARSRGLRVINRRTMMVFRAASAPQAVAQALDADAVLLPSLRRTGDTLVLTVRLWRAAEGRTSWEWRSPGSLGELVRLSRQVADSVVARLPVPRDDRVEPAPALARPVDAAALDLYAQGRYWWNRRGPGLLKSIGIFTSALDLDPTFAPAYAGMADAYVQLGYGSLLRPEDAFPKARAAAERALRLDPSLAEPHATLGFVNLYYDWDWNGAEREFQQAIALNPSYATAHEWYGLLLSMLGRANEARAHTRRAQELDPLSTAVAGTAAWVLYQAGHYKEAEDLLRVALRTDSSFALGRFYLGRVHQARGRPDSALAEYQSTGPLRDWVPTIAAVGHVHGSAGRRQDARAALARLDSLARHQYVTAYAVALVHASLGQRDSAFAWLERGLAERTHWMVWLRRDPRWGPIRTDPRFNALVRRLRLPA